MEWTAEQRVWVVEQANAHLATAHPIGDDPGVTVRGDLVRCNGCSWLVVLTDSGACVVAYGPLLVTAAL